MILKLFLIVLPWSDIELSIMQAQPSVISLGTPFVVKRIIHTATFLNLFPVPLVWKILPEPEDIAELRIPRHNGSDAHRLS